MGNTIPLSILKERLWYNLNMHGTIFKNFISPQPDRVLINPKMGFAAQIEYFQMHRGSKQIYLKIFCEKRDNPRRLLKGKLKNSISQQPDRISENPTSRF